MIVAGASADSLGTSRATTSGSPAGRDAILAREPARERGDACGELAPRRLAPDAELLGAERDALGPCPRSLDEQARQCARAQRLEIHAGRIIPEGIILGPS